MIRFRAYNIQHYSLHHCFPSSMFAPNSLLTPTLGMLSSTNQFSGSVLLRFMVSGFPPFLFPFTLLSPPSVGGKYVESLILTIFNYFQGCHGNYKLSWPQWVWSVL